MIMKKELITKKMLIDHIADDLSIKKDLTEKVITLFLETIAAKLENKEKIFLSSFGTFEIAERKAKVGVNPSTKAKITIPAHSVVKFKVAKTLKDAIR